tara:strand:- start:671 stop:931 length:261 start_codon:yes stop_codon:yes gene_type:complete
MEKIHNNIMELEKEINSEIDDGDKYLLQMELVDNYKKLVDMIFTDYLILKTEQDKRKNYTKSYYQKNKDKIKKISLEHYYNKKNDN